VNEDLRSENLPLVKRKHGPAPKHKLNTRTINNRTGRKLD
jgi:hypothetical protein